MLRIMLAVIVVLGAFLVHAVRADASPYVLYGIQETLSAYRGSS